MQLVQVFFCTMLGGKAARCSRECSIRWACLFLFAFLFGSCNLARATERAEFHIDFSKPLPALRALHGVNKGPLVGGGLIDLTTEHRALSIPLVRLHDCRWPNPDVVDMHVVFPDPRADPAQPASYDFLRTDEYLAAIHQTGAGIVYRLGESIEHTTTKRFVHPPRDPKRWAAACLGLIRHYNEGWADGFRYGIRYWEIWNEPENRPAMWSGTDEDYFQLYRSAARAIKAHDPRLQVGGPAVGHTGRLVNGEFQASAFVTNFLSFCRRESLPLDFFSWHCYTDDPMEFVRRAEGVRRVLDAHGFPRTESHLNEWNYLPGNSWSALSQAASAATRHSFYEAMAGPRGAAFVASTLIELQDAPITAAHFFHGEIGGFGLFSEHGLPAKNFYALRAFQELLSTPRRVQVRGGKSGQLSLLAGLSLDGRAARWLASGRSDGPADWQWTLANIPWQGPTQSEIYALDNARDLSLISSQTHATPPPSLTAPVHGPSVLLIKLRAMPPLARPVQ